MIAKTDLGKGSYADPANDPFKSAIGELKTDAFHAHEECSGKFHEAGYGDRIQWYQLNYHPNAFTHEGYGGDDKVTGYHMDGCVTFFTAQFDDGKTDDPTLAGMPTKTDNHYVQGAEISMPALTRRDYNLAGWTVTDRKSGETIAEIGADEKYKIDADVTFTALWGQKHEVVYVYYQAVDSNGTAFSKDTKLLKYHDSAYKHPGYSSDSDTGLVAYHNVY